MNSYHSLMLKVLSEGTRQSNRTGIDTLSIPGAMLQFDLTEGFPAVTTKKLFFSAVVGELLGFIRGYSSAKQFRDLGCNVWNQNANDPGLPNAPNRWLSNPNRKGEDDLGRVYGKQWTDWRAVRLYESDSAVIPSNSPSVYMNSDNRGVAAVVDSLNQLKVALETIENDPTSRRIIVNAWRPDEFDQMALPPCHVMFQFLVNVEKRELNLCWYQRSVDLFLGCPFNIASYALLLELVAKCTNYTAKTLTGFFADTHIYVNHIEQVKTQLARIPYDHPRLALSFKKRATPYETLCAVEPSDVALIGYECHSALKAQMAV